MEKIEKQPGSGIVRRVVTFIVGVLLVAVGLIKLGLVILTACGC